MPLSELNHTLRAQVETSQRDPSGSGRVIQSWTDVLAANATVDLTGPLAQAGPEETQLYMQQQHDVIFGFVTEGLRYPNAKPGDRFVDLGRTPERFFYIRGIDDTSPGGRWTIYYLAERPSGA